MAIEIRELGPGDMPFLQEMLYAAVAWRPRPELPPRDVALARPLLAMYHENWGRLGDAAFVANEDDRPVGAVWYRVFTQEQHGEGYVDERTPELAIAVDDGHRGRGIGRALMEAAHANAQADGFETISLSVDADNPARSLYERLGYRPYEAEDGKGRMILELTDSGGTP